LLQHTTGTCRSSGLLDQLFDHLVGNADAHVVPDLLLSMRHPGMPCSIYREIFSRPTMASSAMMAFFCHIVEFVIKSSDHDKILIHQIVGVDHVLTRHSGDLI